MEREEGKTKFWLEPARLEGSHGFRRPEIGHIERLVVEIGVLSAAARGHWPDLDKDSSILSLPVGRRSGETHEPLRRWLQRREPVA